MVYGLLSGVPGVAAPAAIAPAPELKPVLESQEGKTIRSIAEWERRREQLKHAWLAVLGPIHTSRPALRVEFGVKEQFSSYTRTYVRYQVEEGIFTDGYLLEPATNSAPLPAVVVFHPTTPLQAKGVAGVDLSYPEEKRQGVHLAQRGYVAWCPRNFINEGTGDWKTNTAAQLARHPKSTGMARMLLDAFRAADFLETQPNVDPRRIGCIGHSLGAKEVLYAMAFDARYRAGVFSEGGIGLSFSNWEAPWYLGDQIRRPGFAMDHHELLALIAPRAFFLLAGDSADDDRSGAYIEAAKPVYSLCGAEAAIAWFNHRTGHAYPAAAREAAEKFLDQHLKP